MKGHAGQACPCSLLRPMIAKTYRLTKVKDFDRLFKEGRSAYSVNLGVKAIKNDGQHPRVAVVVSKKVSKRAAVRNLIKRRLRVILYQYINRLPPIDLAVITLPPALKLDFNQLQQEVEQALNRLKLI